MKRHLSSRKENKKIKLDKYKKQREIFDQRDETGFNAVDELGIDYVTTEVGLFLPSGTVFLDKLLEDLIFGDFIKRDEIFLDAGSGDARVNHVAALNGVEKSIGIEYDKDILEKSKKQTDKLEELDIIEKNSIKLIAGDFAKLDTYLKEGVEAKNINVFFNYLNGWRDMLSFINENSPVGTKIILVDKQFGVADRVTQGISKFDSIDLLKIVKYVSWKDADKAEILTPKLLDKIKKEDHNIENQYTFLDVSKDNNISEIDSDSFYVTTVYLCEKKKKLN